MSKSATDHLVDGNHALHLAETTYHIRPNLLRLEASTAYTLARLSAKSLHNILTFLSLDDFQFGLSCVMAILLWAFSFLLFGPELRQQPTTDLSYLADHCAHVKPIPTEAFIERQDTLAQTLHSLGASAYIAEPGANAGFYANVSGSSWHLSERPLLVIVTPTVEQSGSIAGNVTVLTPLFEATRAKLLPIPSDSEIAYPEWPEDANPYEVAISAIAALQARGDSKGKIFVDGAMRQFVVEGLQKAAGADVEVVSAPVEIRRLRERKSEQELEIMKCVNEV